jgi:hypothetical protein
VEGINLISVGVKSPTGSVESPFNLSILSKKSNAFECIHTKALFFLQFNKNLIIICYDLSCKGLGGSR